MFVRPIMPQDEDDIVELAKINCAISTPDLKFSEVKVRETCRSAMGVDGPVMFVIEENRRVIAFLLATINEYRHAEGVFTTQEVIFVHPRRQGSRAAVLLMRELLALSDRVGAIEITGGNDNDFKSERTARFLSHFGFEKVGFFMRRMVKHG